MKPILALFFGCLLLLKVDGAKAQNYSGTDTALQKRIHMLAQRLNLSTGQEQVFYSLEVDHLKTLDSARKLRLGIEERRQWLSSRINLHDAQVRSIMTYPQWKEYQDMLAGPKDSFIKNAKAKNVQVKEIKNN